MKTKELNLSKRLNKAQKNLHYWQKELCLDLLHNNKYSVEYDLRQIENYIRYMKNTCIMHDYPFSALLL